MVSGTTWPDGDPFLQRQNEPTIAVSTRNEFHLMGGSNDYRTVDLPGLPEGKTIGDSWLSSYFSIDGGGRWTTTLLPGYPQDDSLLGNASPLRQAGYEASADPVIRAGTHGLFYYSGIAFTRGDAPPSAGFVATYMDLNNDERKSSIGYVRTTLFDENADGLSFIDKPWIAVDKPRPGSEVKVLDVYTDDGGVVQQTVECGDVYSAYARIQGDGSAAIRSQIMFTRSEDCATSFSPPIQLSLPDTINQGAAVAIEPNSGRIQVAWRQFANASLNCTRKDSYWRNNADAWPVNELELAGTTYESGDAAALFPGEAQTKAPKTKGPKTKGPKTKEPKTKEPKTKEPKTKEPAAEQGGTPWLVLRQLLAAWLNVLGGADQSEIIDTMAAAEAWLLDHPPGSKPKNSSKKTGNELHKTLRYYNQGKTGPGGCDDLLGDASNGMLGGMNPDAIMVVTSTDFGATFSAPVAVTGTDYFPFEQSTTPYSFRTTGYPTMTFDGVGRSYIAYATRGAAIPDTDPVGGDSRIVVTTSMNGSTWTAAQAIDKPSVPGHQLMPALEFSRGKVFLLYYDMREDISTVFDRFIVDLPVDPSVPRHSTDVRVAQADAADVPMFTDYSVLDVLPSTQASRYPFMLFGDGATAANQQMQYNPPNLPMFKGGTVPFFGDYIDLGALQFIKDSNGAWQFDIDAATGVPVVHAVWTDNRDVIGPHDGDWTRYVAPTYHYDVEGNLVPDPNNRVSLFDPLRTAPSCDPTDPEADPDVVDRTKMRNQNVYTSRLTLGLAAAVPGNNRPLGTIQRVFVGFVQNTTDTDKQFQLEILNQPPNGSASFDQFSFVPVTQVVEIIERQSSIARSIYVSSTNPDAVVNVRVSEVDTDGNPVPDGLATTLWINPDSTSPSPSAGNILNEETYTPAIFNPAIFNPAIFNLALLGTDDVGIFSPAIFNSPEYGEFLQAALTQLALLNPAIFNPAIFNLGVANPAIFNPAIFNPAIFNPAIFNPAIFNPAIFNPAIFNPAIFNVDVENPAIFNPAIFNPAIFNPAIFNPAIFNTTLVETSVVVTNEGNSTAAYSVNLDLEEPPEGFLYQLMIFKTYLTPVANGCDLREEVVQEGLVNELTPDVNGSLLNPDSTSFYVAPGDNVVVTVRIVPDPNVAVPGDPSTIDTLDELNLSQSIVPQAVETVAAASGETQSTPVYVMAPSATSLAIDTASLPGGQIGAIYSAGVTASGGDGSAISWSLAPGSTLPPGLSVDSDNWAITGIPTTDGTYGFVLRAQNDDEVVERTLSITISSTFVDQSQPVMDLGISVTLSDDPVSGQIYAQVVTAGMTGMMTEIGMPAWCLAGDGDLSIGIEATSVISGIPDGTVLTTHFIPNANIPGPLPNVLYPYVLANPQPVLEDEPFAITLSASGTCAIQWGPVGDPYTRGSSYFDKAPFSPVEWELASVRDDLPFETRVTPTNLDWETNDNATDGVFAWSRTFGRTDTHSVRIQTSSRSVPLSNPGWRTLDNIPVDPTVTYEASVWTYTPDGGVGHIPAILMYLADGTFVGTIGATGPSGFSDPTGVWVQKSFTFRLADIPCCVSVASVRFTVVQDIEDFFATGTPTTVFFDDAVLRTIAPVLGPNLLPRPSFDF